MAAAVGRQRRWPKGQQRHVSCCETKSVLLGKYLVVDGANSKAAVNGVGCQGEEGTPAVAKHHHRLLVEPRPSGQGWSLTLSHASLPHLAFLPLHTAPSLMPLSHASLPRLSASRQLSPSRPLRAQRLAQPLSSSRAGPPSTAPPLKYNDAIVSPLNVVIFGAAVCSLQGLITLIGVLWTTN
ncbi:hypothetical protein WN943_010219 [Citrus x changshan-huyou]